MSTRRHAWIDASAGVAGDMLLGALIDAGADLAAVQQAVDSVIADSVRLATRAVTRAGQHASRISVEVIAQDVPVRGWTTIEDLITTAGLAAPVRDRALLSFDRLAEAEARIHHLPKDRVQFHEVGGLDSIADIVGVAAALHALKIDSISASAVAVGSGRAQSAH
ncbi:MAG TPA: nickel insertion protein, partial [Propionibacteriaceae bacterium]|nr:nickel insertion protein [Propionibacteriaceae bacterium]